MQEHQLEHRFHLISINIVIRFLPLKEIFKPSKIVKRLNVFTTLGRYINLTNSLYSALSPVHDHIKKLFIGQLLNL